MQLQVMYAMRYKIARDGLVMIKEFEGRGGKFEEVIKIGRYGIMQWACQFGIKRKREKGEEKMDSRLLAICDMEGRKVDDVEGFRKILLQDDISTRDSLLPESKFMTYESKLKEFCKIKVKMGDNDVVLKEKVKVFSKTVLGMMEEFMMKRVEENKKLKEEKKECVVF